VRIELDRNTDPGHRPVYRQIADQIQAEIDAQRLSEGARLPTIRELARELGVNRDTVALAYEDLAARGSVEASVGRGTFVASPVATKPGRPFQPAFSTLTERLLGFERARPRFGNESGAVPMHVLIPDASLYPADEFRKALNRVMSRAGAELLQYGDPQGHEPMRGALAERLSATGIETTPEEILLCHGASQGISLALRLFAEPGDTIALEEPTYNNVLAAVHAQGLRTAPVPVPTQRAGDGPGVRGLDLGQLERTLERPEVKALYTIPTFHNPLGITTPLAHRRGVLEIAARCGKPVIEDGYELDLGIDGRPPPPLAALDRSGLVIHLSSFSKSLFPGVRVGGISARGRTVDALLALKRATDHSDAMPLQAALAEFLRSGAYDRHLTRLRGTLRSRRDALHDALTTHMPEGTHFARPDGGYQVWVELPEERGGIDTDDLLADAARAGVLFAPGSQFNHDGRPSNALRLSFAMAGEQELERGCAVLGEVVRARLAEPARAPARVHI
jgi:DNA-binding transcriptional MocR family regulator